MAVATGAHLLPCRPGLPLLLPSLETSRKSPNISPLEDKQRKAALQPREEKADISILNFFGGPIPPNFSYQVQFKNISCLLAVCHQRARVNGWEEAEIPGADQLQGTDWLGPGRMPPAVTVVTAHRADSHAVDCGGGRGTGSVVHTVLGFELTLWGEASPGFSTPGL